MERWACVNVAAFPLQLLLGEHPDWRALPVAVVEDDRPQALVVFVNARARRAGVRTGQRHTTALSIEPQLRAGAMPASRIEDGIRSLAERLRRYSPRVEPSTDLPGVFWLDVGGFERLHPLLRVWAEDVHADLDRAGMWSSIAVGFSRFGVYALAITHRGIVECADPDDERATVRQVPLGRLGFDADVRDRLLALGVKTVGDFLRLPGDGIRTRFGDAAGTLHQLASGQRQAPLVPMPLVEICERAMEFDAPEDQVDRLLFAIKRELDGLVVALVHQGRAMIELTLNMTLDDRTARVEHIRPAAPTLDVTQWLSLIRLRLDALQLSSGIVTLHIVADVCPEATDQRRLFPEHTRRDADAANQALARLRAECGEQCVVRARLCNAQLPSAQFRWEPMLSVPAQSLPRVVSPRPLVRRIYTAPAPLGESPSSVQAIRRDGPYIVSGGWWTDREGRSVQRDYYYLQTPRGDLWWVYFDRRRQQLFLQGCVE